MTATIQPTASVPAQPAPATASKVKTKDVRYLALRNFAISISVFNIIGYTVLGFEQPWLWPFLAVATAYATDLGLEAVSAWAQHRKPRFLGGGTRGFLTYLLPAHITALACNMLLYANNQFWPIMLAVIIAVSQKHFLLAPINGRVRHFMNPSNLGISVTLLALGSWVSIAPPYQFTEWANTFFKLFIPLVILIAGTIINAMLTRKTPLIIGWLGAFIIQALIRHWLWGVQLNTALGVMAGVAFILFTNYMVSDPGTTPQSPRAQFMFGSSIAVVYAVLMEFNIVYTLFFATTIVCAARGVGWWAVYLRKKRSEQRAVPAEPIAPVDNMPAAPVGNMPAAPVGNMSTRMGTLAPGEGIS